MIRRFFALASAAAITIYAGTVISFAARTGISSRVPASSSDLEPHSLASDTDVQDPVGGDLSEQNDLGSVPIVSISAGKVVVSSDDETSELVGSALSEGLRVLSDYGFYIDLGSNSLGSRLYVPSDYAENSFYVSNGNLFGMRNSTFTCYIGQYSVRFPAYSVPQYRLTSGSQYTWQDINIPYEDSPNVSILGARTNFWSDKVQALLLLIIGGIGICLYLKR